MQLATGERFWLNGALFFAILLGRYVLVAGGLHLLLQRWSPSPAPAAAWLRMRHDITLAVGSSGVFALMAALLTLLSSLGFTRLYGNPDQFGWWYLPLSYGAVLLLQDAFFYFSHRLFHHPSLYLICHRGHHRTTPPTPWTSFAFDPIEALIQALFLIVVVMVVPLHPITLLAVLTTMSIWAAVNHLGAERLPGWFPHHWLGRWMIGPAHHSIHHRSPWVHYGLYFTFWDQVFGTEDRSYLDGSSAASRAKSQRHAENRG